MKRLTLCVVALLVPSVCQADDKAEWKKILGNWKITAGKVRGKELPAEKLKFTLKIEKDQFTITGERNGEKRTESTAVKIDFSKSPKQIDFVGKDGKPESHGIFKLDGKKLTFCFDRASRERPTKFESKADMDARVQLLVFERVKKE